ncbi:trichohyalin-like isoform X2 [Pieris napi]|uniref:trichohyalin-like isoform X1 n=1 Tax=Pieris napi TaxID=78633 RepID=UPI001FB9D973|nr:trichohyalin-like isoform X1 [Pieris napi]XP_047510464.1 trichohyalin-like isoform X1 [Pieris napi]XP_047510465.1 trichohyalin-like isoform X1 [Pieris napi]XP_047510466.1 trichohyalin-like isoform X2 [Pieris napi]
MQNFHSGDFNNVSENERKDKSNLHTHMKNLDDSFNDDTYNGKAQAQVDKDVKYRHDLKEQCEDNFKRAQNDYEESRAETSRIQQAGNYIMSEQYQQDLQQKHDDSVKLHDDIESFKKDCVDFRELQTALINLEEDRIDKQSHEMSDRSLVVEFERERKLKDKDELNTRMCTRMVAHEVERQDREDVITVKHEDEDREKLRREDVMVYEKKQEDKRELSDGLLTQIEENKQSVRDEKQRELNFSDRANALMELEDEREEERARRKKERDDQYFSDLRQQIADNAVRRQKQKEQDAM